MLEPPYIGCALTIIDPGPVRPARHAIYSPRRNRDGSPRLMKVKVEHVGKVITHDIESIKGVVSVHDLRIDWRAGSRTGSVLLSHEGTEWVRGWGPQARDSLLAMRKLTESAA